MPVRSANGAGMQISDKSPNSLKDRQPDRPTAQHPHAGVVADVFPDIDVVVFVAAPLPTTSLLSTFALGDVFRLDAVLLDRLGIARFFFGIRSHVRDLSCNEGRSSAGPKYPSYERRSLVWPALSTPQRDASRCGTRRWSQIRATTKSTMSSTLVGRV